MNTYPASCDFMVARPPTYQQSMINQRNTLSNQSNKKPIIQNHRRYFYMISNTEINRPVIEREPVYHRKKRNPKFCNIL